MYRNMDTRFCFQDPVDYRVTARQCAQAQMNVGTGLASLRTVATRFINTINFTAACILQSFVRYESLDFPVFSDAAKK